MSRPAHPRLWIASAWLLALLATGTIAPAALAQSASPGSSGNSTQQLRSLAVFEYLGSYRKPSCSRLVPVAIWDGTEFQPGSLYLANPTPLAVESGTLYELMRDGVGVGQIEVTQPERLASRWIALGKFLPNPKPGPVKLNLPASLTRKSKFASSKPHFAYKPPASTGVAGGKTTPGNGGPPRGGKGAETGRPTLHQRPESGPGRVSGTTPAEEGRPTLHHRSIAQQLSAPQKSPYPDRPHLHYTTRGSAHVTPPRQNLLKGLPPEMHQMPAISDVNGTTDHSYAYSWPTPADKIAALRKMEVLAVKSLPYPKLRPQAELRKTIHQKDDASSAPELKLTFSHERFHAFQLDYGSGPVYVFSAQSGAPGVTTTYITLIAKPDFAGGLITLYKNVTPANLLAYQPRMKLIDAVDATGSGRADLLFDLISGSSREFALFSVQGGQAREVFHTGQQ